MIATGLVGILFRNVLNKTKTWFCAPVKDLRQTRLFDYEKITSDRKGIKSWDNFGSFLLFHVFLLLISDWCLAKIAIFSKNGCWVSRMWSHSSKNKKKW
jgi:hypothetical protein